MKTAPPTTILLVEDDEIDRRALTRFARAEGLRYEFEFADCKRLAVKLAGDARFDIVLADNNLPDGTILESLDAFGDVPVIVLTGAGSEDTAVEAMKRGAYDYLVKDIERRYLQKLPMLIANAIRHAQNERALRQLRIESNVAGVFRCTESGYLLDGNETLARILGFTERALMIEHYQRAPLFPREGSTGELLTAALRDGATSCAVTLRQRSGAPSYVLATAAALELGPATRVLEGSLVDITSQKQAELAMRRNEERYRSLFENDLTGDCVATPDCTVLQCNKSFAQIFGFPSADAARGTNLKRLFQDPQEGERCLGEVMRAGKVEYAELSMAALDGSPRHVVANVNTSVDERGRVTQLTAYFFDDTRRRRLESQVVQMQKMEAIGRLASGVAHDFNNLLTVILGYANLAGRRATHDEALRRNLDEVMEAARRAEALTGQLLSFSRDEEPEIQPVEIAPRFETLTRLLRPALGRGVELSVTVEAGTDAALADPVQLEQILLNLVLNARDAMPEGGSVSLEASAVDLGPDGLAGHHITLQPGRYVLLRCVDDGHGMTEEVRRRIFEPFFTTKKEHGTGLGLATVYALVERLGGSIAVESELGVGTRFDVLLPAVEPAAARARAEPETLLSAAARSTVLLVDDDRMATYLAQRLLETVCGVVLTAADSESAEATFAEHAQEIELLVTDVMLPGVNGTELARRLRARKPALRVIYVTGFSLHDHAGFSGDDIVVSKPFSATALRRAVIEQLTLALRERARE